MKDSRPAARFSDFIRCLAQSGLVAQDELDRRLGTLFAALTDQLVADKLLTVWQCDKLCDGKWKGFFLDGYKMLGHVETDDAHSYYLVEEVATGRRFAMRVTPRLPSTDPDKIEYTIVREIFE